MTTPQTGMAADDKLTTIKVPTSVRDRIKARADRFGFPTLAAYLDALIDRAEWDETWEEQRAIEREYTKRMQAIAIEAGWQFSPKEAA